MLNEPSIAITTPTLDLPIHWDDDSVIDGRAKANATNAKAAARRMSRRISSNLMRRARTTNARRNSSIAAQSIGLGRNRLSR